MSLLIKVVSKTDRNIMDIHKKVADEKGMVWYCHSGNPKAKPYNKKNKPKVVYFKEQDKLYKAELENIIPGPKHGGSQTLPEKMKPYIPEEYPDVIEDWHEQAICLKCKNIKQIDYNIIENLYYEKDNKQYNPKIMAAVVYVNFIP